MNKKVRITKAFKFEAGHALYGHDGLCKNIHGHGYKLFVTLIGSPITNRNDVKYGMMMDFGDLKKIINKIIVDPFDHATILNVDSPHKELADELEKRGHKIVRVNYQPTTEMILFDFVAKIQQHLPEHIQLHSLKLRETETCYAEWFASDNED